MASLLLISMLLQPAFASHAVLVPEAVSTTQDAPGQPPFDGMYFNYTFSTTNPDEAPSFTGSDVFSTIPVGLVGLFEVASPIARRFVNGTSRVISQSQNPLIADGTHDWTWIPNASQPGVTIPVSVRSSTDQQFQIVGNSTFTYANKTFRCWKLTSTEGSIAYYELSSGLLVNATFVYQRFGAAPTPFQDQIILVATNVTMNPINEGTGFDEEIIAGGIVGLGLLITAMGISHARKKMRPGSSPSPGVERVKPVPANLNSTFQKDVQLPRTNGKVFPKVEFPKAPAGHTEFPKMPADQGMFPKMPADQGMFPKMPADKSSLPKITTEHGMFPKMPAEQGMFPKMPAEQGMFPKMPAEQGMFPKMPAEQGMFPKMPAEKSSLPKITTEHGMFPKVESFSATPGTQAVKPMAPAEGPNNMASPSSVKPAAASNKMNAMPSTKPAKQVSKKALDEKRR